jgi:mycothiol synthase
VAAQIFIRPPTLDDTERIGAVINQVNVERFGREELILDDLRAWLTSPDFDLERDARIALRDGEIVGFADLWDHGKEHARFWIDPQVPQQHGWEEITRGLIDSLVAQAREVAVGGAVVRFYVPTEATTMRSFLEREGYRIVRYSFRMRIDLDEEPPAPRWPDGITVRTMRKGEDDRRVYDAHQDSFADHYEFTPDRYDEWAHWFFREGFDPTLWWLAEDDGEVAGVCLCWDTYEGDKELGLINVLGVRKPWRRRGLARALLLNAFAEFRSRGNKQVGLGVDGENVTGAVRLYESAGMRVVRRGDHYERPLE